MSQKTFSRTMSVVLLSGMLAFSASSAAHPISQIRFAVDPSYPPFESKQPDGKLVGFDIDLGNALCAQLKAKCIWIESSFDSMIPGLKARKFDAVLSDMGITEERRKQIDFTRPLYNTPVQLVAGKDTQLLPTAASLQGKRIGVEQGTVQERYAQAKWQPHGVEIVAYDDQAQVESDLVAGRIDALFTDGAQAELGFLRTPQGQRFALMGPPVHDPIIGPGTAIGLRKGSTELKQSLDQAFDTLVENGTFKRIMDNYFTTDISIPR
ncbi:ABC transporter substrate-binding protein [Sodalis sp. TME1]|nr:ABC transporter substrate-binding protein [Sodalis sp. TME1]